ncbi:MAG: hypothetical protein HQL48_00520 [Gammaproteobacteria bacterium]|nr:hypothetical protein [Gammaproteobacteria bacterium]
MAFSVSGIGSGLDVNSIVAQLMDPERLPLTALQNRKQAFDNRFTSYGHLAVTAIGIR